MSDSFAVPIELPAVEREEHPVLEHFVVEKGKETKAKAVVCEPQEPAEEASENLINAQDGEAKEDSEEDDHEPYLP